MCVCCREVEKILAKIDRLEDSLLFALLTLSASTCSGSFKLRTSNIGGNMGNRAYCQLTIGCARDVWEEIL